MPKITENAKNHRKCQKPPKMSKITKNAKILPKMPKITKNTKNHQKCQKSPKIPKITENAKNHQKCQKSPKMQKNYQKCHKITENAKKTPKLPKTPKMPTKQKNATNHKKCPKSPKINLLECPIPALSSVLVSQKIRITSPLPVFLKHGQMDFSKASNSISHQLTLIFPENCQIFLAGSGGLGGLPAWVSRPERPKGAKDEVGARRAPN